MRWDSFEYGPIDAMRFARWLRFWNCRTRFRGLSFGGGRFGIYFVVRRAGPPRRRLP